MRLMILIAVLIYWPSRLTSRRDRLTTSLSRLLAHYWRRYDPAKRNVQNANH